MGHATFMGTLADMGGLAGLLLIPGGPGLACYAFIAGPFPPARIPLLPQACCESRPLFMVSENSAGEILHFFATFPMEIVVLLQKIDRKPHT